jgi:drug/metabolite transporter (DMT)-like permease
MMGTVAALVGAVFFAIS